MCDKTDNVSASIPQQHFHFVHAQWRTGPTGPPAMGRWALAVSHLWGPSVSSN